MAYGTLDMHVDVADAKAQPRTSKYAVAFAAVALMAIGVVAVSTTTVSTRRLNTVVDSNRNRGTIGKVSPGVRDLGLQVLNMTVSGLRWGIMGFNVDQTEIIPLVAGKATADWERDFKQFTNALPEESAAVGVYNFPYWADDNSIEEESVMITWAPKCVKTGPMGGKCKGLDPREEARAGYYLPGIILALNTDEGRTNTEWGTMTNDKIGQKDETMAAGPERTGFSGPYRLDEISASYFEFCKDEMGLPEKQCSLERAFHNCPFESEDENDWTDENPCKQDVCDGDSFQKPEDALAGSISQQCCNYIEKEFCADPANYATSGCHQVTLTAIDKLCEEPNPADEPIIEFKWSEEVQCLPECASACAIITEMGDAADTWKKCEGCKQNLMPDPDAANPGQISQCYPGALSYEMNTCCGNELTDDGEFFCEQDENLSSEVCNMLEYFDCKWIPQADCPEEKMKQDIADSPVGCCYMPNPDEADDLFGTTASFNFNPDSGAFDFASGLVDETSPEVLCAGGTYALTEGSIFVADTTCEDVKAGFEGMLQAYLESLVPDGTTAAPAERV